MKKMFRRFTAEVTSSCVPCWFLRLSPVSTQKWPVTSAAGVLHVRVCRARLAALDDVQRDDQIVAALDRGQIVVRSGFVPGHPGTADGGLDDAGALLKGALQLLSQEAYGMISPEKSSKKRKILTKLFSGC